MLRLLLGLAVASAAEVQAGNGFLAVLRPHDILSVRGALGAPMPAGEATFSVWVRSRVRRRAWVAADGLWMFQLLIVAREREVTAVLGNIFYSFALPEDLEPRDDGETRWEHAAVVIRRGARPEVELFLNGVSLGAKPLEFGASYDLFGPESASTLTFGNYVLKQSDELQLSNQPQASFWGFLDEICMWDAALGADEVRRVFEQGRDAAQDRVRPAALVLLYDMEEESGDVLVNRGTGGAALDGVLGAYFDGATGEEYMSYAPATDDACAEADRCTAPVRAREGAASGPNTAPVLWDDLNSVSVVESSSQDIFVYASDADGDWVDVEIVELPPHGKLFCFDAFAPDDRVVEVAEVPFRPGYPSFGFRYAPAPGRVDAGAVRVAALDGRGGRTEGLVRLEIVNVDDPPRSYPTNATVVEDDPEGVFVPLPASDADSRLLTAVIDRLPAHGALYYVRDGERIDVERAYSEWYVHETTDQYAASVAAVSTFWPSTPNAVGWPDWHPNAILGPGDVSSYGSDPRCFAFSTQNAPAYGAASGGDALISYGPWDSRQTFDDEGYSEFIEVEFEQPVYVTGARVGICRGPSSIVALKAWDDARAGWFDVYKAAPDPAEEAYYRETEQYQTLVPYPVCVTPFLTQKLRLEVDTVTIDDWNEFDYVKLIGAVETQPATFPCDLAGGCGLYYVPDPDFEGADDFSFFHCDCAFHESRCSESRTATIDVAPVPDAPTVADATVDRTCGPFGSMSNFTLRADDVDAGAVLTYEIKELPRSGLLMDHRGIVVEALPFSSPSPRFTLEQEGRTTADAVVFSVTDDTGRAAPGDGVVTFTCAGVFVCPPGSYYEDGAPEDPDFYVDRKLTWRDRLPWRRKLQEGPSRAELCVPCPAGSYSARPDSTSCEVCAAGSYATDAADDRDGEGVPAGARACAPCPAGTKGDAPGKVLCAPCVAEGQTSTAGSTACDKCASGYYDASSGLGDVSCRFCADADGVDADACGVGTTVETLPLSRGWWRKASTDADDLFRCPVPKVCGGGAGAGDDLCRRGARGVLCNTCAAGHYLDRLERRCVRCAGAAGVSTFVVLLLALGLAAGCALRRAARAAEKRPELWNAIEWWFQALVLFWYFGQTFTTFMRVESVRLVPPLSWLRAAADVVTGSFVAELGGPCLTFLTYYERFVVTCLLPAVFGTAMAVACALHLLNVKDDARRTVLKRRYATAVLFGVVLFHTTLTVHIIEFFNCDDVGGDRVLRQDYRVSCESPAHRRMRPFATAMFVVYVLMIPGGLLLWLWAHRRRGAAPREALRRDGPAAFLADKYQPQFYYWEVVTIWVRLVLCGLQLVLFRSSRTLRLTVCAFVVAAFLWSLLTFRPFVNRSHGVLQGLCQLNLALLVVLAFGVAGAPRLKGGQLVAVSCVLVTLQVATFLSARYAYANEPVLRLANLVHAEEPFAADDFSAAYKGQAARTLARVALQTASSILDRPTATRWRYLLRYLRPLDVLWDDSTPARAVVDRHAARLRDRAAVWEGEPPTLSAGDGAWLRHVFGPLAPKAARGLRPSEASPRNVAAPPAGDVLGRLGARLEGAAWTRFDEFRLVAFCAHERSKRIMEGLAGDLCKEAGGAALAAIGGPDDAVAQPCLDPGVAAKADLVKTAAFRAFYDADVCTALLRGVALARMQSFERALHDLFPGTPSMVESRSQAGCFVLSARAHPKPPPRARFAGRHARSDDDSWRDHSWRRGVLGRRELSWQSRCHLKCAATVSVKTAARAREKVAEYAAAPEGRAYPYAAHVADPLRATLVCDDAEAMRQAWDTLRTADPRVWRLLRVKNKIDQAVMPFNVHGNFLFSDPEVPGPPVVTEIQLWSTALFVLNDVSHWQYEGARAERFRDVRETRATPVEARERPELGPKREGHGLLSPKDSSHRSVAGSSGPGSEVSALESVPEAEDELEKSVGVSGSW